MLALSPAPRGQGAARPGSAPDISGVWLVEKFQPVLFPNGGAPLQPWAETKLKATNAQTDDPNLACLPEGVPRYMISVPYPMEIFQGSASVLIIHEGTSVLRQIHMSRQHPKDLDPTYAGDSVGKWEGDTFVVDTTGLNDRTWLDTAGHQHTDEMHLTERFVRTPTTINLEYTIDDPKMYSKPWVQQRIIRPLPPAAHGLPELIEYSCEENNRDIQHLITTKPAADR